MAARAARCSWEKNGLIVLTNPPRPPKAGRCWATLLSVWLGLWVGPSQSFAHDPGLSSGRLRLFPDRIETELTLARADVERIVPLDADGDGDVSPRELATARGTLEKLAGEAWEIRADDGTLAVRAPSVRFDGSNNVHFGSVLLTRGPRVLAVHSLLISRLPRGHRQFVTVVDQTNGVVAEALLSAERDALTVTRSTAPAPTAVSASTHSFNGFFMLGIEHIVTGYDHLLFLFALLILAPGFRQAGLIISSFTAAHSITLALSTCNVVSLNSRYAEPLIAASIVYVGIENLLRGGAPRGRWLLTFAFGLVHGFGFASALRELGVGSGTTGILEPLLAFNLGVETGQIAIAAIVLPLIWQARKSPALLRYAAPACSALVIALGAWWLLERTVL